jgi:hypothetical protein
MTNLNMRNLLLSLILLTPLLPAHASTPEPGSELTVYLLTIGPGQAVYERFGHNAIRIVDRQRQTDWAYNYGLFDMGESGFILRFLQGRMWYWMAPMEFDQTLEAYREWDRTIWIQELNLTPTQRLALRNFLNWNAQPQNARYRYDYYTDNCSTRVRDALDRAADGQIRKQLQTKPTGHTFRWHTRRLMRYDPLMYTALNFILGQPIDRPLSAWEEAFLPELLMDHLQTVTTNTAGKPAPLVGPPQLLYQSTRFASPAGPPNWLAAYLLVGLGIGVLQGCFARFSARFRGCWWGFSGVVLPWFLLLGGAGIFLAGAWLLTSHHAVYHNENLLHFNPLFVGLLILIVPLLRHKPWAVKPALWLAVCIVSSSLLGLILKTLPAFHQANGELIALTLPANLGTLYAIYELTRPARSCR